MANEFPHYPAGFAPTTVCKLCRVPMVHGAEDIVVGHSRGDFDGWLEGIKVAEETDFSYQRQEAVIRYPANAEDLYNAGVNYCSFTNSNFGGKTFYAFIQQIEYKNPNVSWLHIQIDVINSWIYDVVPFGSNATGQCMERMTPQSADEDEIGVNLMSEPCKVNPETHVINKTENLLNFATDGGGYAVLLYVSQGMSSATATIDRLYSASDVWVCLSAADVTSALTSITYNFLEGEQLLTAVAIPRCYVSNLGSGKLVGNLTPATENLYIGNTPTGGDSFAAAHSGGESYVPNNWKMYTYPYCCAMIDNGADNIKLAYEYFNGRAGVKSIASVSPGGGAVCFPINYLGSDNDRGDARFTLNVGNFPSVATQTTDMIGMIFGTASGLAKSVVDTGAAFETGDFTGTVSALNSGWQTLQDMRRYHNYRGGHPTQMTIQIANNRAGIYCSQLCCPAELAKQIDEYFSLYGYNYGKAAVDFNPLSNDRSIFCYYKTAGFIFPQASVLPPNDQMQEFCQMFDKGIRLWYTNNAAQFGIKTEEVMKMNSLH